MKKLETKVTHAHQQVVSWLLLGLAPWWTWWFMLEFFRSKFLQNFNGHDSKYAKLILYLHHTGYIFTYVLFVLSVRLLEKLWTDFLSSCWTCWACIQNPLNFGVKGKEIELAEHTVECFPTLWPIKKLIKQKRSGQNNLGIQTPMWFSDFRRRWCP